MSCELSSNYSLNSGIILKFVSAMALFLDAD